MGMGMEVEWRWTKVKFMFKALEGAFEGRYQRSDHKYPIARPTDSHEQRNNWKCVAASICRVPSNCRLLQIVWLASLRVPNICFQIKTTERRARYAKFCCQYKIVRGPSLGTRFFDARDKILFSLSLVGGDFEAQRYYANLKQTSSWLVSPLS